MEGRHWDLSDWYADVDRVAAVIGWRSRTEFTDGLQKMAEWYSGLSDKAKYQQSSKKFGLDTKYSVSAIVACYRDNQAIPIMYERLKNIFSQLNIDYEIVFVNDCSPDDSEEVIRAISRNDRRVYGVSHSRNFGSQAAFRSGMAIASKNACVLLDGDLQDPPELIGDFVAKWREGYDVVYGRRVKREAPLWMQFAYKAFYRVFDVFSYVRIPHDAGDFSLMDRRVVEAMLSFPERDLFLRGVRAYSGFRQAGVDYIRPERLFGVTTNSLWKNIGWAKKGILSFSHVPLNILSVCGVVLFGITVILMLFQLVARILFPSLAPRGITTVLISVLFFGSLNLFAISLAGEYIGRIFEEVKRRPHFIRRSIIREGEIRPAVFPGNEGAEAK
jgi:dolichol-phosphate mannosyltransferase